jgi:hypothetical protein
LQSRGAAWSARHFDMVEIAGSNPVETIADSHITKESPAGGIEPLRSGLKSGFQHGLISRTNAAALVPLVLKIAIPAPCLMWIFFAWLAESFNRRTMAIVTAVLGLFVCAWGCFLIAIFTAAQGVDGQTIDSFWPFTVVGVSAVQCMLIPGPLGWIWIVVGLNEIDK